MSDEIVQMCFKSGTEFRPLLSKRDIDMDWTLTPHRNTYKLLDGNQIEPYRCYPYYTYLPSPTTFTMPESAGRGSSPPPCPEKSPRRKGVKQLEHKVRNAPEVPTFRYSSGYINAPAVGSAAKQDVEDPFSDAMARPNKTRHVSRDTVETTNDSVFDDAIAQRSKKFSLETDITTHDDSSSYSSGQISPMGSPKRTSLQEAPARRSTEPFPSFTNPTWESTSQRNSGPDSVHHEARTLVSKLKGVLQYLEKIDERFDAWASERHEKRLQKRRRKQLRSDSAARAKEIDREHKAQIKAHREKEETRNKRAAKQLKEQKKEMKAQAKRRDKAAKDENEGGFFATSKLHVCRRGKQNTDAQKQPIGERVISEPTLIRATGISCLKQEVKDYSSEDDVFLRGAEEYDPRQY